MPKLSLAASPIGSCQSRGLCQIDDGECLQWNKTKSLVNNADLVFLPPCPPINIFLATSLTESVALIVQECKHFTDYKKGINAWN